MRQWYGMGLVVALSMACSPVLAAPLRAEFADVVTPDAELKAFLQTLVDTAQSGIGTQSRAYAVLDTMTADTVRGFTRGLDPLEQWTALEPARMEGESGVELLTNHMVEMGELPADASEIPDYRQSFLELLVALLSNPDEPLGIMAEMGDAVCSPARLAFNAKATAKFVAAHDTDASGIYLYPREISLRDTPESGAAVTGTIAPYTLLVSDYQADQPDAWIKLIASDGLTGWTEARDDYQDLSQQHLCFGKVDGQYKIVGFYSYGL